MLTLTVGFYCVAAAGLVAAKTKHRSDIQDLLYMSAVLFEAVIGILVILMYESQGGGSH